MLKILKNMSRKDLIMSLLCMVLIVAQVFCELALPDYMSDLTVMITNGSEVKEILFTGLKMLGYVLADAILAILCSYLSVKAAAGFGYTLTEKVFNHVISLGKQDVDHFSVPSLITRTTNDITQIEMTISIGVQNIIKAPVMAIWAIIKILGKSWQLTLVTGIVIVMILIMVTFVILVVIPKFRLVQKLIDSMNRIARENISGISVVHAFNAENYQNEKFDEPNTLMLKTQLFNQRTFAALTPFMTLMMNGLSLAIYWLGAYLVNDITGLADRVTMFSEVVVFSTYATYVIMSFLFLVMIFMFVPQAQVSAERINEVLDQKESIHEGIVYEGKEAGTIEFRNVSFAYPGSQENALTGLNFKVSKGQTLAIIGSTGSGKTTLISLMARFYDATDGEVLIDGVNVKDYSYKGLYDKLGYITQKAMLFNTSIKGNILFGESKDGFTDEDAKNAVELSQASEFVNKKEEGIDYKIAQGGHNVSGGQKQRLSIARAIARKPEILIFDDSFSALDYKTDSLLRHGLRDKLPETTKVIVAQRISTIRHADQIIVLNEGKIESIGTHDELMKNSKVYQEIASSQLSSSELNRR